MQGQMFLLSLLLAAHHASSIQLLSSPPTPRPPRPITADAGLADRRTFVRGISTASISAAAAAASGAIAGPQVAAAVAIADDGIDPNAEAELLSTAILSELNAKKGPVRWNLIGGCSTASAKGINGDQATPLAIDPPYADVRYGTSTLASTRRSPFARSPPARYPDWMEGTWLATYKFTRATFPQGRGVLSLRVPGAGIGTVLSLPNIGCSPAPFTVRYLRDAVANEGNDFTSGAAVYEDLAYSVPRRLEAFWPDAKVLSVRTGNSHKDGRNECSAIAAEEDENKLTPSCSVTGEGCTPGENPTLHSPATRLSLDYEGPTRAGPRRGQTIDCSAVQSIAIVGSSEGGTSVVTSKQFVQYNVQQDLQTYYKEICSFRRIAEDEPQVIEGNMRVAAFLPYKNAHAHAARVQVTNGNEPPEPKQHDERLALALYDYKITLQRLSEEAVTMI